MNLIDTFNLDIRALHTFVVVLDEGSVSRAAVKLGVSQSAVSHTLERLRKALGDPLFVKSGRGIVPTRYAFQTGPHVRQILYDMHSLASGGPPFTPETTEFTDIMQRGLMGDRMVVFYDPKKREAPQSVTDYLKADHVSLVFASGEQPALEAGLSARGLTRRNVISVSNFSGLPEFLRGTDMLATAPERMSKHLLRDFEWVPLPFSFKPFTLLMVWHRRNQNDPAHLWLRNQVNAVAATMNGLSE